MTAQAPSILSAIQKLRFLFTPEEKKKWVGITSFAFFSSLFEIITATVIVVFAQVLTRPETGQKYLNYIGFQGDLDATEIVLYMALILGGIYLVKNIIASAEVFYQNFTIQKMSHQFKHKLLSRYAEVDYGFTLTRNVSQGYQIVASDSEVIFTTGITSLAAFLSEAIVFCCLVGMIIYMNPSLAFVIFAMAVVVGLFVVKILLPKFYQWGLNTQKLGIEASKHLLAFFYAFKEIVLLGKREAFVSKYHAETKNVAKITAIQTASNAMPRIVLEVLFMGMFVTTIAIMCMGNDTPTQMMGILGGYLYAGFRLMPGLNRMINMLNNFKFVIPNIERIYGEYKFITQKNSYEAVPNLTFNNSVTFKDVDFAYPNVDKNALTQISFTLNKGESIGVVGETGSGKSTLIDLLLGLLKPNAGEILVDSAYPVRAYEWHAKIGYVPQSVYLMDDTIEVNIAFGAKEIDVEKLNAAIDAAQLRKFIDKLSDGVKTQTGERGVRLSGGERQRIAIARALYHEPEILIFDEATSALDNDTEMRLMDTIQRISQDRTVVMIAHRLTTLKNCDRIIVIEDGKIARETDYEAFKKAG